MQLLLSCDRLKFLQLMAAGFDAYDIGALNAKSVVVANNADAIAISVAEHTILLMLAVKHRFGENWLSAQRGKWDGMVQRDKITELTKATVGIVGFGRIGREVAQRLKGWDMKLLYYDVIPAPAQVERELEVERSTLHQLLREADIVSLHVPLNDHTRHLISEAEFQMMKPSAVLINTCRGPVVDEKALLQALSEGRLAGAGLDVLEKEPAGIDNPLLNMENVVVTPHVAGSTLERVYRMNAFALSNVKKVLQGLPPDSVIGATHV
ncbi:MAG: hypothetical protein A2Y73_02140 [Chloroflexi bacterium RBG_13_56_8]|nr:MAG: hypothetical protein A2Y73_02140 [Chloroflexi bacterium RBG_13_56_8]